jgi:putative acetyltransferase
LGRRLRKSRCPGFSRFSLILRPVHCLKRSMPLAYRGVNAPLVIRPVSSADDAALAQVIGAAMAECGAGGGAAPADTEVALMSQSYAAARSVYFVVEDGGQVVGGAGIAALAGAAFEVCELRKMYVLPAARGRGFGELLLRRCLRVARGFGYQICYLETLATMAAAHHLYERAGFRPLPQRLGASGNCGCDRWFALEL